MTHIADYASICEKIDSLCRSYPFLVKGSAGKSVLGRELFTLRTGVCDEPVLYAGGFHAQEWISTLLLLRFAERLCAALKNGGYIAGVDCRRALLGKGIIFLPCVNPDGVELALHGADSAAELRQGLLDISGGDFSRWNANARGVDLNRNFNAGWHIASQLAASVGVTSPCARRWGGERPESEPETAALVSLCESIDFRHIIAFHSQGEEIYWRYGERTPKKAALMARIFAASSGYAACAPDSIASHAGFKDWFIERFGKPGFTVELGRGENPLPLSQLDGIYRDVEEMLLLGIVI